MQHLLSQQSNKGIVYALTFLILSIILFFGINPKSYNFKNNVALLEDEQGIHFRKYGLVYAELNKEFIEEKFLTDKGFSVELVIRPQHLDKREFQQILTVHDGNDAEQFLIGQWMSSFIVMNGNDYANKKNIPRMRLKLNKEEEVQDIFITITSNSKGSDLYLNGDLIDSSRTVFLLPHTGQPVLTLGNSVYGKHSWQGNIYGLSLHDRTLSPETIKTRYTNWSGKSKFSSLNLHERPALVYLFKDIEGTVYDGTIRKDYPLITKKDTPILTKQFFVTLRSNTGWNKHFLQDLALNFFGFIPLGFFFFLTLSTLFRIGNRSVILSAIFCFAISFGIEFFQAWIPSRSSQTIDLFLNTLGGLAGAVISWRFTFFQKLFQTKASLHSS